MALSKNLMPMSYFQGGIAAHRRPSAGTLKGSTKIFRGALCMTVDGVAQNVVSGSSMEALCTQLNGADANAHIKYSARRPSVRVQHVDPAGNNKPLFISITYGATFDVKVNLATDGGGAITSTANDVVNAIRTHAEADRLLRCKVAGAGTGATLVVAVAATAIAHIELLGVSDREMDNSDSVSALSLLPSDVFAIGIYGMAGAAGGNAPAERAACYLTDENTVTKVAAPLDLRAVVMRIANNQTYVDLGGAE